MQEDPLAPGAKLRLAFDMFEAGVDLMRQNLERRHPDLSPVEIEESLVSWLRTRPGAEHGDAAGTPGTRAFLG